MSEKEIPRAAYDKNGREIMIGDVVKIYHFTAALRRKRRYMYKHVTGERVWDSGYKCLFLSHLNLRDNDGFYVAQDGKHYPDYEIVQSMDACFDERPRNVPAPDDAPLS